MSLGPNFNLLAPQYHCIATHVKMMYLVEKSSVEHQTWGDGEVKGIGQNPGDVVYYPDEEVMVWNESSLSEALEWGRAF